MDGARASWGEQGATVLLIGHGSRDLAGADEFRAFAGDLAACLGGAQPVVPCFLELAAPSILGGIQRCVGMGARRIVAVPLFLFGANHVKTDIPAALHAARRANPGVAFAYGAPLGVQPELLDALDARLTECEQALRPSPREDTAVLLVERGSSDPDANAQVAQLARLLWEGRGFGWVEHCFIGITRPSLDEGLTRCAALGARRVLVLPCFLFTGLLVQRISRVVEARRERFPGVELAVASHLGRHPRLLDLTLRRVAEAELGDARMSCDRCKYRVSLAGFEDEVGRPQVSDRAHGLRADGDGAHDPAAAAAGVEAREAFFAGLAAQWKPRTDVQIGRLRDFVALAGVAPGDRVLDVGCGTGALLPLLAEAAGLHGLVTALDISPQMLGIARRRYPHLTIRYLLADAAAVPEAPGSYDRIVCSSVLPHFADPTDTLAALARLLRPGGSLLICHDLPRAELEAVHRRHGGPIGGDRVPEPENLCAMLRAAGLGIAALHDGADCFYVLAARAPSWAVAPQPA